MQTTVNQDKKILQFFLVALGFSLLLRIIIGGAYFNDYDTYWYREWVFDLQQNGLFDIYARADAISLDYPPVYLFFLYLVGQAYKIVGNNCVEFLQMLLMKFWPIVFDILCAALLYHIFAKRSGSMTGFAAGVIWLCNPSILFNTAIWGQTDQVMCFLLILSFYTLENKRPVAACILFAIAGLTKYQCLYFTPILLLEILRNYKPLTFVKGIGAAAATVATVFIPFMIGAKNPFLFFNVYLGGAGKYAYCTLSSFNLYGIFKLNWVEESVTFLGIPLSVISVILLMASLILVLYLYLFGKRTCPWVAGFLFMQCIFMLTTRMHERYQIVVLPFILMAYFVHKNPRFLGLFSALSIITAINQAFVLLPINAERVLSSAVPWVYGNAYDTVLSVFSCINMIVFVWSVYECVRFFMTADKKEENNDIC